MNEYGYINISSAGVCAHVFMHFNVLLLALLFKPWPNLRFFTQLCAHSFFSNSCEVYLDHCTELLTGLPAPFSQPTVW